MNQKNLVDFLAKQSIEEFINEADFAIFEEPEIFNLPDDEITIQQNNQSHIVATDELPF